MAQASKTTADDSTDDAITHRKTTPTIKPPVLLLMLTIGVTALVEGILLFNPQLLGGPNITEIATWVVAIVSLLIVLRLGIWIFILRRTVYTITDTELRREYQLFMRHQAREIPLHRLRGIELDRGRIQTLLGYGDIRFLTGGTNQSLGFLTFQNVDSPEQLRDEIRTAIIDQAEYNS